MNKDLIINKIVKDLPIKEMRSQMSDVEWFGWFEEVWDKAINFTHCCKSDSEQLQAVEDLKEFARNNCREWNTEEMQEIIDRL
jgi:hypothetical protein